MSLVPAADLYCSDSRSSCDGTVQPGISDGRRKAGALTTSYSARQLYYVEINLYAK